MIVYHIKQNLNNTEYLEVFNDNGYRDQMYRGNKNKAGDIKWEKMAPVSEFAISHIDICVNHTFRQAKRTEITSKELLMMVM